MAVAYSLGALLLFGGLEDAGVRDELAGVIGLTTAWTLAYFGSSREWNRYYKVHAEVLDAVSKRDAKKNA